jgi:YYY domain-containing protein
LSALLNEPSLLDLLRATVTRQRLLRALLVAAALGALALAARLFASPDASLARPLALLVLAILLGEAARLAGRSRREATPAVPPGERDRRRPSARRFALIAVILLGASFRLAWARWDEGALLHPDEYGLTGTLTRLSVPKSATEWFDTRLSPMSPYPRYDLAGRRLPDKAPDEAMRWGQWPQLLVRGAAELLSSRPGVPGPDFTRFGEIRLLGRRLSALASVLTLGLVFLLARRLFGDRTALLATALAALAPLPLQQARFLTVDGFAALFATAALLPVVRIAGPRPGERGPTGPAALFGLLSAMAVASRLNLAPVVLLLPLALFLRNRGAELPALLRRAALPALLGAVVFLATFRVTQPMAFRAPRGETSPLTFTLNPDWLRNVELARAESSLEGSSPPAEQWTGRPRIFFPAYNTFLWGLGVPGGLLAFAGLGLALGAIAKGRARGPTGPLLALAWTAGFFLFMAARPVSSVRYFLPLYPLFAIFGALALERLEERLRGRSPRLAPAVPAAAVLLALAWAWGFTGIWRRPNTRIEASRFLYATLPAATNVVIDVGEGPRRIPVRDGRSRVLKEQDVVLAVPGGTGGSLSRVEFPHVSGPPGSELRISIRKAGTAAPLAEGTFSASAVPQHPLGDTASVPLGPLPLEPGRVYEVVLSARGGAVTINSSVLLGETWDEVLPCGLDGLDGGLFDVRLLPVRGPDDAGKRSAVLAAVAEADAVVLSSPRSLWVVPRLPSNYPFTRAWYRALFDGRLGFAPAPPSPFQATLPIGPLVVSDAAGAVAWGRPPALPVEGGGPLAAEEAFSVYDHAPVWVFTRVAHRGPADLDAILPASLLDDVVPQTPRQAGAAPGGLMLPPDRLARDAAGRARNDVPSPASPLNRLPALATVAWCALLALLGLAGLPFTAAAFGRLPSAAFAFARLAGLLLASWLAWLLASIRVVPFGRGAILVALAALLPVSAALAWRDRASLLDLVRRERRTLLATELLFHALLAFGILLRLANPDLWHPSLGGEKPMAFAFLNALLRTTEFPPQHPWFAGGALNYYYFGYVLAALPARLLGIVPGVAYNLAVPMFFALSGAGAFAVGHSLVRSAAERGEARTAGRPLLAGLVSAGLLVVLGNLGQVRLLLRAFQALGGDSSVRFAPFLAAGGALKAFFGAPLPIRSEEWYWNATRLIPAIAGKGNEITEFPFFTFLFGDLHPHLMALPLGLFLLAWALAVREGGPGGCAGWLPALSVGALALGAVRATNPWDGPFLTLVVVVSAALAGFARAGGAEIGRKLGLATACGLAPVLLSAVLYRPFDASYVAPYTDLQRWAGAATPLSAWLWLWGLPAFAVASLVAFELGRRLAETPASVLGDPAFWRGPAVLAVAAVLAALATLLAAGVPSALVAWPLAASAFAAAVARDVGLASERRTVLLLSAAAFLVTIGVDRFAVGGDRMNTVFKLSFQAFAVLAVLSGPALSWTVAALGDGGGRRFGGWHATTALLLLGAALYPLTATPARLAQRFPRLIPGGACVPFAEAPPPPSAIGSGAEGRPRGLDGTAFLCDAAVCESGRLVPLRWDGEAIDWLRAHEKGSPAILEAVLPEYRWGSRFSTETGIPAVAGWSWHVRQHHAAAGGNVVTKRIEDVAAFYGQRLALPGEAPAKGRIPLGEVRRLLARHRVRWVVAGLLERAVYPEEGLAKLPELERLGILEAAYRNPGVTIYRVRTE